MWTTTHGITVTRLLGGRCNIFLVQAGECAVLVDTSWKHARRSLQAALDGFGFPNHRGLTALFLTHAHFDHAENAAWVCERYHPRLIAHELEAGTLRAGDNPPITGAHPLIRFILSRIGRRFINASRYTPANPDITFTSRLDLPELGPDSYLMHTPGHTAGSGSLVVSGEIAMVGDTLHGVFPNNAYPPFLQAHQALMASWRELLDTHCTIFLPSHGKAICRALLEREYAQKRI